MMVEVAVVAAIVVLEMPVVVAVVGHVERVVAVCARHC